MIQLKRLLLPNLILKVVHRRNSTNIILSLRVELCKIIIKNQSYDDERNEEDM